MSKYTVSLSEWDKDFGGDEYGCPIIIRWYYVMVTDADGNQWQHFQKFHEYEYEDAKKLAKRVEAAGGPKDWSLWRTAGPKYGSKAWKKLVNAEDKAERRGNE